MLPAIDWASSPQGPAAAMLGYYGFVQCGAWHKMTFAHESGWRAHVTSLYVTLSFVDPSLHSFWRIRTERLEELYVRLEVLIVYAASAEQNAVNGAKK
jgi:hypothetical protein